MSNTEAKRFAYWTLVLTVRFALPWLTSQSWNWLQSLVVVTACAACGAVGRGFESLWARLK